jgi:hypothetical protein
VSWWGSGLGTNSSCKIAANLSFTIRPVVHYTVWDRPTDSSVKQNTNSTPLRTKLATGHDPEPDPLDSHRHNVLPLRSIECCISVFQVVVY